MFRCITELKGLIVDIDSFGIETLQEWENLYKQYTVVFLTSNNSSAHKIIDTYGEKAVQRISRITRFTSPNIYLNTLILENHHIKNTEIVYVSKDLYFLQNAMTLMNGTIWVTQSIDYEEASTMPDLVCGSVKRLEIDLENHVYGFFGETAFNPFRLGPGQVLPVDFSCDDRFIRLYTIGRYFAYQHYMSQLHPYSSAIWFNKNKNSRSYRIFDDKITDIFSKAIEFIKNTHKIEYICSVPSRPSEENRFSQIVETISDKTNLFDITNSFSCVKDYAPQKQLTEKERKENIHGVFRMSGDLGGKTVLIIDDIVTTGSTIKECSRELFAHNAGEVIILVLAINQKDGTYWSSNRPGVFCPYCGTKMKLYVNSKSKKFFFTCPNDKQTLSYGDGVERLVNYLNQIDDIKNKIFKDKETSL